MSVIKIQQLVASNNHSVFGEVADESILCSVSVSYLFPSSMLTLERERSEWFFEHGTLV